GAIRTAVLASMLNQETGLENKIRDFKGKVTAKNVEFEFLGKDPNSDVFRFLQVGDAFFGDNYTVAIRMVNINERKSSGFWDESKSQLIEAICPEDESTFEMKLNSKLYDLAKDKVHEMPNCMSSLSELFKTINSHTKALINKDIQYWKNYSDIDDSGKVDNYIEKMCKMLSVTNVCKEGESCVLRIGYGSGWCFITGAWAKKLENFADDVVPASRPKNRNYSEYDFPKTRRVDDNCELLGFVRLSLVK
ncbi:MAG: type III-A CRISPR-associated RAMP protein Csm5, partial [Bacteroidaceae bacterium]